MLKYAPGWFALEKSTLKLPVKIALVIVVASIIFSAVMAAFLGNQKDSYILSFGLTGVIGGFAMAFIGLISAPLKDKRWTQGFFLGGGILLLLGYLTCSTLMK